jgi:uncharacterized protein YkwD
VQKKNNPKWLESLESRQMLSVGSPTDLEQYAIELINRARANPSAQAARYGITLNEGLPSGTISNAPAQPLAVNLPLVDSARKQSQWMIDTDTFSHTGAGGSAPNTRMSAAGYHFDSPSSWAENIALRSLKTTIANTTVIDAIEKDLFVDIAINDRGHRVNLLSPQNNEIGVGSVTGLYTSFEADMLTQDFASSANHTFVTGVIYTDAVKKDNFYTPGEGLGGVTITARRTSDGATFTTQSYASGGYSLKLDPGTYKVTANGGKLGKTITYDAVTINHQNVKRDFTPTTTPPVTVPTNPPKAPEPNPPTAKPPVVVPPAKPPTTPATPPDRSKPHASIQALRKRETSHYYRFTIAYTDNTAVSTASLGTGDVQVKGAGNYARIANFVSSSSNGKTTAAIYEVKGPGGNWNRRHNGLYTIWVTNNQVKDTSGNFLPAQQLGSFTVRIAPAVSAVAPASTKHLKLARNQVLN